MVNGSNTDPGLVKDSLFLAVDLNVLQHQQGNLFLQSGGGSLVESDVNSDKAGVFFQAACHDCLEAVVTDVVMRQVDVFKVLVEAKASLQA